MSNTDETAVKQAVTEFYTALNAMLKGDPSLLKDVYSHATDVSYMPAEGGFLVGWENVYADWEKQAAAQVSQGLQGSVEVKDIKIYVGANLAAANNTLSGRLDLPGGGIDSFTMRESHVFRKEDGVWKMISQHADQLVPWTKIVNEAGERS